MNKKDKRVGSDPFEDYFSPADDVRDTTGRPEPDEEKKVTWANKGLKPGWRRKTIIVHEETYENLVNCAYWMRENVKDVLQEALDFYLKDKNTKPIPKSKRLSH
ncbi:hypothetical protein AMJ80_00995 [bacterium SM23_31]|nr:MAG: hypothetical protein AMJ80_00995 [bacterium SM23_31]